MANPKAMIGLAARAPLLLMSMAVPAYIGLSQFAFFEPYLAPLHLVQAEISGDGPRLYGPYPDDARLAALRANGYKKIVVLLDPSLVYEASLLAREQERASRFGIALLNFPMRSGEPLDTPRNSTAVERIRKLFATHPDERYYVHCYLGRHRTQKIKQLFDPEA